MISRLLFPLTQSACPLGFLVLTLNLRCRFELNVCPKTSICNQPHLRKSTFQLLHPKICGVILNSSFHTSDWPGNPIGTTFIMLPEFSMCTVTSGAQAFIFFHLEYCFLLVASTLPSFLFFNEQPV